MTPQDLLRAVWISLPAAGALWIAVFRWSSLNFWLKMGTVTGGLAAYTIVTRGNLLSLEMLRTNDLWIGVGAALALYAMFWGADRLARALLPAANRQSLDIFVFKALAPRYIIALLLAVVVGPGEELYWRGLVQEAFQQNFGVATGVVLGVVAYGGAHVLTGRWMLAAAAAVGGAFWGVLYAWQSHLWPVVISHVVWDLLIFLVRPIGADE